MTNRDYRFTSRYYYGLVLPEHLVVNASLQKFAQRVSYICSLETSGKISSKEASKKIKTLCSELVKPPIKNH